MSRQQSFVSQVSAVSPLKGDAIDGSPQPKRRRPVKRAPIFNPDNSLTYGCRNPQCDCHTWAPQEYARHMGGEFYWLSKVVIERWPESDVALLLTGGVTLAELTDDECRKAAREVAVAKQDGSRVPVQTRLRSNEYIRRSHAGTLRKLTQAELADRQRERRDRSRVDVVHLTDDEVREASAEAKRLRGSGQPVPEDIRAAELEHRLRYKRGELKAATPEHRSAQGTKSITAWHADRNAAREAKLPPPAERRARRLALGLSGQQLAEKLGVTKSAVWSWESGSKTPSAAVVSAYARLLQQADVTKTAKPVVSSRADAQRDAWPPVKVKTLRTGLGLTQQQLSERIGVSKSSVTAWERGLCGPSAVPAKRLDALMAEVGP